MRKQIAAANWKMNLTYQEAETLINRNCKARWKPECKTSTLFLLFRTIS